MTTRDFPCLYCLALDGTPSVEHVVPAGLGRHVDIELPPWAVCGSCNNTLGRQVDEALVHAFEVRFARGIAQVPDHKGRVVKGIEIRDGELEFGDDGRLNLTQFISAEDELQPKPEPGTTIKLPVTLRRRGYRDQRRRIARAILKIGLGMALREKGPSFALHPDFDAARRAVLGTRYDGYLLSKLTDIDEPPHLHVHLLYDVPGVILACRLDFGWAHYLVDLIPGPLTDATRAWSIDDGWNTLEFTADE